MASGETPGPAKGFAGEAQLGWSPAYAAMVERNYGLVTQQQQERLRRARVAVMGVGGLGGIAAEVLVRSGVGALTLADKDRFEESNLNRQIFAFRSTLGQPKVEVTERFLRDINPELQVTRHGLVDAGNAEAVISGCDVVVLTADGTLGHLALARAARRLNIPLVEGWGLPFLNVRVFDRTTPTMEEAYGLSTADRKLEDLSPEELRRAQAEIFMTLAQIAGVMGYYDPAALAGVLDGSLPGRSFAPMVWGTGVAIATETLKVLTGAGERACAPGYGLYDPFKHQIPKHLLSGRHAALFRRLLARYLRWRSPGLLPGGRGAARRGDGT